MRFPVQLAIVLFSAVAYGWTFPPDAWRWLAWVALAPLFFVLRNASTRRGLFFAWLWTVAMAYTVNDWFPRAVSGYFAQPFLLGMGLFFGVSTLTAGIQYMGFAAVLWRAAAWPVALRPWGLAAAWVSADLARLKLFGGDPWALIGYSQIGADRLLQVADLTGVHGVGFVIVAVNAALAEMALTARAGHWVAGLSAAAAAALPLALVLGYGTVRLRDTETARPPLASVGIVQAHLPLGSQWRRDLYGRNLEAYLTASLAILQQARPQMLVWPENAMTFFLADEPAYRASIGALLQPFGAELIAGGPFSPEAGEPPYSNAAFLIASDGRIRDRYDKQILLPFAEYLPLGRIDLLRRHFGRVREFTPGAAPAHPFDTPIGRVGVVVCNEGFFPEPAASRVREGATVLVNLSNDSWLGDAKYSAPAFDMVVVRAIEQRRWIVRASTAGPSALVDPFGRITLRTRTLATDTLVGRVAPSTAITLYNRVGDAFAWACLVATALAWGASGRRAPTAIAASRPDGIV